MWLAQTCSRLCQLWECNQPTKVNVAPKTTPLPMRFYYIMLPQWWKNSSSSSSVLTWTLAPLIQQVSVTLFASVQSSCRVLLRTIFGPEQGVDFLFRLIVTHTKPEQCPQVQPYPCSPCLWGRTPQRSPRQTMKTVSDCLFPQLRTQCMEHFAGSSPTHNTSLFISAVFNEWSVGFSFPLY